MERVFSFLRNIACNNNKVWFEAHRDEYAVARRLFEQRAMELIDRMAEIDERVACAPCHGERGGKLTLSDITYRFNRDTRFSPDKSPYKRHFGAYLAPWGKKSQMGGYYVHYEPGECMLAVGSYCLEPKQLRAVRQSIVDNIDEYRRIVECDEFRRAFPNIGIERVKTCPKGFDPAWEFVDYIRPKDFCVWRHIDDSLLMSDDWLDSVVNDFIVARPFMDFVCLAIEESYEDEITDIKF